MVLIYTIIQTLAFLLILKMCVVKVFKSPKSKAPGSFVQRSLKYLGAVIKFSWKIDKVLLLQDILGIGKKVIELPLRTGEVVVMTGAAGSMGLEVLKKLLKCNFKVIIGIRNLGGGEKALKKLRKIGISTESVVILKLDLKSLESVRSFARKVLKETERIDLLINNAAINLQPYEITEDGYEPDFQVNYLGHFLLTNLLLQQIKDTAIKKKHCCRIVNVSSNGCCAGNIDFMDLEKSKVYSPLKAYCDAKFAQVLHANYLDMKMSMEGCNVRAYSLHPGMFPSRMWINLSPYLNGLVFNCLAYVFKTAEDAAKVVIYTALSPELEKDGGVHINNFKNIIPHSRAEDVDLQKQLWERSILLSEKVRFPLVK